MPNTMTPGYAPNQTYQTPYQPYQPAVRNITMPFVNGEAGALAYPGPLNATSYYMDSNSMTIYEKTLDGLGQVTAFNCYDLVKRENAVPQESEPVQDEDPFIKKSEIEALIASAVSAELAKNRSKYKYNANRSSRNKEDKDEE